MNSVILDGLLNLFSLNELKIRENYADAINAEPVGNIENEQEHFKAMFAQAAAKTFNEFASSASPLVPMDVQISCYALPSPSQDLGLSCYLIVNLVVNRTVSFDAVLVRYCTANGIRIQRAGKEAAFHQ